MRRHRYERRLRARVRDERGCLGSLAPITRELLGLRAGLDGPPLSRSEAAAELGISRGSAARIERAGLRELHVACGGSAPRSGRGGTPSDVTALAGTAPALQAARYLPVSSAPDLRPAKDLDKRRGSQEVKGVTESSPSPSGSPPVPASAASAQLARDGSGRTGLWIGVAAMLAALAALTLVLLRRTAAARQAAAPTSSFHRAPAQTAAMTEASAAPRAPAPTHHPAPEPAAEPAPERAAEPAPERAAEPDTSPRPADEPPAITPTTQPARPPQRDHSTLVRSASVLGSAALSFAARELLRRRRRR